METAVIVAPTGRLPAKAGRSIVTAHSVTGRAVSVAMSRLSLDPLKNEPNWLKNPPNMVASSVVFVPNVSSPGVPPLTVGVTDFVSLQLSGFALTAFTARTWTFTATSSVRPVTVRAPVPVPESVTAAPVPMRY